MPTADSTSTDNTTLSEGDNVSEVALALSKVAALEPSALWWSTAVIWLSGLTAFVAAMYFGAELVSNRKSKALDAAKSELIAAQDRERARERDEANTRIAESNRLAEQARAESALAQLQLAEVQERLADRHLSTSQRAAFIDVLREAPGDIRVACAGDRPEPCAFAKELIDALSEAGWKVTDFNKNAIFVGGSSSVALAIHVNNDQRVPKRAGVLQHAFKAAGFEAIAQVSADVPDGAVALLVKHKL